MRTFSRILTIVGAMGGFLGLIFDGHLRGLNSTKITRSDNCGGNGGLLGS